MRAFKEEIELTWGTAKNVFADLGPPDAEEMLAKAKLMSAIADLIRAQGLSSAELAKRLGMDRTEASALIEERISRFSIERLLHCLGGLDRDVEIVISKRRKPAAKSFIRVTVV